MAKARILVVEDETIVALDLRSRLESLGYEVLGSVGDGETAIEKARLLKPDVVLMDINLQGSIDGIEAALKIRQNRPVPVIYVTACVDEPTLQRAKVTEPFGYIIKPFEDRELHSHIEIAIYKNEIETRVRAREERLSLASRGGDDGVWDWNLESGEVYFSPQWETLLGYSAGELRNSIEGWLEKVHPNDRESLRRDITEFMGGSEKQFRSEYRIQRSDGTYRWMLTRGFALRDGHGTVYRMAGSQTDITDQKVCDPLTGLPNRAFFMDRLERALQTVREDASDSFAVLVLKSGSFKRVNDTLGYRVGDALLGEFLGRLKDCLAEEDTVVSLGDDGFAVLAEGADTPDLATQIASRIQGAMMTPCFIGEEETVISVTVGVAQGSSQYDEPEDVLRDAQTACSRAQELGQPCQVFDAEMRVQAVSRLRLETRLRQAIERNEFFLNYQPIISLRDGELIGFEALIRWKPEGEPVVNPGQFIPLAEETGVIVPMERWVLKEASKQIRAWQDLSGNSELALSVNFSAEQYGQPDLVETLERNLLEANLDPKTLRLEITETTFLKDTDALNQLLSRIRRINIQLHMDDFGTGYSSLSYLHRFPISVLKIDRSFVSNMELNVETRRIVEAIAQLGKSLRLGVTAEGIESLPQLQYLREMQCDYGQGFLFSKPLSTQDAETLVQGEYPWMAPFKRDEGLSMFGPGGTRRSALRDSR